MQSQNIIKGITTAWKGLALTIRHFFAPNAKRQVQTVAADNYFKKLEEGTNTIQYPKQKLDVPEVGRYQLDVEIDDCIVCDLCAKICPVDCITIDSIKATELIGNTSDGSPKRIYAAKFDIDMAKCMYCGLCTIVCPTECIVMTNQYDKTVFELSDLTYQFSDMSPEDAAEKRALLEKQQAERAAAKLAATQKTENPVKTVTGNVKNSIGENISNVNIQIKGDTITTITDDKGNYRISVPNKDTILTYACMGYVSQEVLVGDDTVKDMVMQRIDTGLKEDGV